MATTKHILSPLQQQEIVAALEKRFQQHPERHKGISWQEVEQRLLQHPQKLWSLYQMEQTGGEPDVTGADSQTGAYLFADCAAESPKGRRSLCYDRRAFEERKEHKPSGNAVEMAEEMGVNLLTEEQYRNLQQLGEFDTKTSSWVQTPDAIRKHGGALFCDRRYNAVFVYHNGASSYYAARGFRACLWV